MTRLGHRAGSLLVTAGTFGSAIAHWAMVWLFARADGAGTVGEFSSLLAVATPMFIAAQFGLRGVYLTLAQRYPFTTYVLMRVAGSALGLILLLVAGLALRFSPLLVAAMGVMKVADSGLDICYARLQSEKRMLEMGALMVANPVLTTAAVATVVSVTGSMPLAVLSSGVISALTLVPAAILVQRASAGGTTVDSGRWAPILRAATPVMVTQLLVSLLTYVPVWVVSAGGDSVAVGAYAGSAHLIVVANLLGASLQIILLPRYREVHEAGGGLYETVTRESVKWLGLGLFGAVLAVALGPAVLRFVYGGEEFVLSRGDLTLLATAAMLAIPTYLLNSLMMVRNRYGYQTLVSALSVLASLLTGAVVLWLGSPVTAACAAAAGGAFVRALASLSDARRGRSVR